jgi:hypothetical protein
MIKRKNRAIPKIIAGMVLSLAIAVNVFPFIQLNGSGIGYCDSRGVSGCGGISGESSTPLTGENTIDDLITGGAAAYLNAYSAYLSYLNRVELSGRDGLDYAAAAKLLDTVLENIKSAEDTYYRLIARAEATPYNPPVLDRLADFDYDAYAAKNDPDRYIFKEVRAYLKNGDITGTYRFTHGRVKEIEGLLVSVKSASATASNVMPTLRELWKINDTMSRTLLFGQYIAQIFHQVQ